MKNGKYYPIYRSDIVENSSFSAPEMSSFTSTRSDPDCPETEVYGYKKNGSFNVVQSRFVSVNFSQSDSATDLEYMKYKMDDDVGGHFLPYYITFELGKICDISTIAK